MVFRAGAALKAKELRMSDNWFQGTKRGILKPLIFSSQQREPQPGAKGIGCLWRNNQISFLLPLSFLQPRTTPDPPFSEEKECLLANWEEEWCEFFPLFPPKITLIPEWVFLIHRKLSPAVGIDSRALRQVILCIFFGDLEHQIYQKLNPAFVSPRLLEIWNRPGGEFTRYKWKRRGLGAWGSSGKRRFSHLSV